MPKDYAKNSTKKKKRSKRKKQQTSRWKLWLFTLFCIGLFIFILLHLNSHRLRGIKNKILPLHSKSMVMKKSSHAKPQFDFYTLLPKEQVTVVSPVPKGAQYSLQIASVKKYAAADRLKAELALLGFDAYVDKVEEGKVIWNRITVGPYFTKKAALADQQRLQQSKITSVLRKD